MTIDVPVPEPNPTATLALGRAAACIPNGEGRAISPFVDRTGLLPAAGVTAA